MTPISWHSMLTFTKNTLLSSQPEHLHTTKVQTPQNPTTKPTPRTKTPKQNSKSPHLEPVFPITLHPQTTTISISISRPILHQTRTPRTLLYTNIHASTATPPWITTTGQQRLLCMRPDPRSSTASKRCAAAASTLLHWH